MVVLVRAVQTGTVGVQGFDYLDTFHRTARLECHLQHSLRRERSAEFNERAIVGYSGQRSKSSFGVANQPCVFFGACLC